MAMYSGRATDAARMASLKKTLVASAIDIGVFYMCIVACFVGAIELVILRTCPRSKPEIGFAPVFLNYKLSFNKAQAIFVLTKRNKMLSVES
jgi:hypothetical protein